MGQEFFQVGGDKEEFWWGNLLEDKEGNIGQH
jgi:hypothetical protein